MGGRDIDALPLAIRQSLADTWWLWLIRGVLAIILGVLALTRPGATLASLAFVIGVYFLIDGVVSLFHGFGKQPEGQSRWGLIIWGIIAILAGLSLIANPFAGALSLALVVGIWAILFGALEIFTGIKFRDEMSGEFWLILGGIAAVLFGILIWSNILQGALAVAALVGIWALVSGIVLVILSFKIKGLAG
ncbi:MAG: HdeD family acid-resistance protein [Chloroflexota bacterium]